MEYLTHERFCNKFKNNFDLVNYAIRLSKLKIEEGGITSLKQILGELEDLPELEKMGR